MVCARVCVLHLGSGNETTLLPGRLSAQNSGWSQLREKVSSFGASIFRRQSSYNVIVTWHYIYLPLFLFDCLIYSL